MSLDPRVTPARDDLADEKLRGLVAAKRYVSGKPGRVSAASVPLRRAPRDDAALETEALLGEAVTIYEMVRGWAWVQLGGDGYVGYLPGKALGPAGPAPSHRVAALRTFVYPAADLKRPPLSFLSFGAGVTPVGIEGDFVSLAEGGFVFARHLVAAGSVEPDYVAIAERFIATPYLWGGRTSIGVDCSGLVQLSLSAAGLRAPRDTDMQQSALGETVELAPGLSGLRRGDLVFWKGHVGIMLDGRRLLHANGHHMMVSVEPLAAAEARIRERSFGPITAVKRIGEDFPGRRSQ